MLDDHCEVPIGTLQETQLPTEPFPQGPQDGRLADSRCCPHPGTPSTQLPADAPRAVMPGQLRGSGEPGPSSYPNWSWWGEVAGGGGQQGTGEPQAALAGHPGWVVRRRQASACGHGGSGPPRLMETRSESDGQRVATPRNTQSRGFPCGLGVGVWWTGEGALLALEYPLPGAGPPVA